MDTVTGASRSLGRGTTPRFSPDGRWIACNRWLSMARPWNLALVEVRTGTAVVLEGVGHIEDYAWSPDSKRLAFTSITYDDSSHRFDIGWIDVASQRLQVLASDTDLYAAYLECEWAPDSRRFVVVRHREYEHDESVHAHDLWLFDIDGRPCRLTHTPGYHEDSPGWIDERRVGYEYWQAKDDGTAERLRYVLELGRAPRNRPRLP